MCTPLQMERVERVAQNTLDYNRHQVITFKMVELRNGYFRRVVDYCCNVIVVLLAAIVCSRGAEVFLYSVVFQILNV